VNLLIVEDDETTCALLKFLLQEEGFSVSTVADAEGAARLLERRQFDLIVLDVLLAGHDSGLDLCRKLREDGDKVPVIFLSGKVSIADRVAGLRAGGDDYIVKPFDPGELVERVRAVYRRHHHELQNAPISAGRLHLNLEELNVTMPHGRDIALTPTEMRLLRYLLLNNGRTVSREMLQNSIWGHDYEGESNAVDVYIRRLRKKIETDPKGPRLIHTVRGAGYKLVV